MKAYRTHVALLSGLFVAGTAWAYSISCNSAGDACTVKCDNGQNAGTMYWNGSRWSDGLRSHTDKDTLAKQMVAAQGTACR
jgi:hypothetical protein